MGCRKPPYLVSKYRGCSRGKSREWSRDSLVLLAGFIGGRAWARGAPRGLSTARAVWVGTGGS